MSDSSLEDESFRREGDGLDGGWRNHIDEGLTAITKSREVCRELDGTPLAPKPEVDLTMCRRRAFRSGLPERLARDLGSLLEAYEGLARELQSHHIDDANGLHENWRSLDGDIETLAGHLASLRDGEGDFARGHPVGRILADGLERLLSLDRRGDAIFRATSSPSVLDDAADLRVEVESLRQNKALGSDAAETAREVISEVERGAHRIEQVGSVAGEEMQEVAEHAVHELVGHLSPTLRGHLLIELLRKNEPQLVASYFSFFSLEERRGRLREALDDADGALEVVALGTASRARRDLWREESVQLAPAPFFAQGHEGEAHGRSGVDPLYSDVELLRRVHLSLCRAPERHLREFRLLWGPEVGHHLMEVDESKRDNMPGEWRLWRQELARIGERLSVLAEHPGPASKNIWMFELHRRARLVRDSLIREASERGEAPSLTWAHNQLAWCTRRARSRARVGEILEEEGTLPWEAEECRHWIATMPAPFLVRKDAPALGPDTPLRDPRELDDVPGLMASPDYEVDRELTQKAVAHQVRHLSYHLKAEAQGRPETIHAMLRALEALLKDCAAHTSLELPQEEVARMFRELGRWDESLWEHATRILPLWGEPSSGAPLPAEPQADQRELRPQNGGLGR